MTLAAQPHSCAVRHSFWRLIGVGVLCAGTTAGGGVLLYYRFVWLPEQRRMAQQQRMLKIRPPVRRTNPYIAGTNNNNGIKSTVLIDELRHNMPTLFFYGLVLVRMLMLALHAVPVLWYAFLTYGLHLCEERILFCKLCDALSHMGPSYIKFGQWMASRPDFFPPALCDSLEKLYDDTPPHSWSHTEKILRRTFREMDTPTSIENSGETVGTVVAICDSDTESAVETSLTHYKREEETMRNALHYLHDIEKLPVNSGSIAQIHRGVLREDVDGIPAGTEVAIKVTHPRIRECVVADLIAMHWFVNTLTYVVPGAAYFDLRTSLSEFSSLICSQLNLRHECDNLLQFIFNFRDFPGVIFPKPLPSLCTEDVLIETFERGRPFQELRSCDELDDVAERGCHMFLKMLFEDNFVHSDLHPGNLLLRINPGAPLHVSPLSTGGGSYNNSDGDSGVYPDGKVKMRHELIVLDTGLVTTLSKEERNNFISLFAAVACGDGDLAADLMLDRMPQRDITGNSSSGGRRPEVDRIKFRHDMKEIFDLVAPGNSNGFTLSNIRIGPMLAQILNTLRENRAIIDGNFASLVLTVIVGEGLGRRLTPDFNIFAEAAPYLVALLEDGELYFLATKLQESYGTTTLLRDSLGLVRRDRAVTYLEMGTKKVTKVFGHLLDVLTGSTTTTSTAMISETEADVNVNASATTVER